MQCKNPPGFLAAAVVAVKVFKYEHYKFRVIGLEEFVGIVIVSVGKGINW